MRLFHHLRQRDDEFFSLPPAAFTKESEREILALALGGTLYAPATKESLFSASRFTRGFPATSMVLCLEDTVADAEYNSAVKILTRNLIDLAALIESGTVTETELPLIFIRVRSVETFLPLLTEIAPFLPLLTGFVFPKFDRSNANEYFDILASAETPASLYGMPILETQPILYAESRMEELFAIRDVLAKQRNLTLNIRVGGTDLCSFYGLRRSASETIYDVGVVRRCLEDILAIFMRPDSPFILSGPVWEYYSTHQRETAWRDGLLAEARRDKLNGFVGKTVIHPCQIPAVIAAHSVSREEYDDAQSILEADRSDRRVSGSSHKNKMNETLPHRRWAERIVEKARLYGVLRPGIGVGDLLQNGAF